MIRNAKGQEEIFLPYLLGFHQHLEKHREAPRREKNLLFPRGLFTTRGVLKTPAVLLAHSLHDHLE